jgi:outer membrane protein OmpA-like peptidoglycan-associated protein
MLIAALGAFAAAASAGIFLAFRHFTRGKMPAAVALIHGLGGATGFLFVLLVVVQNPDFRPARQALYLFIVTILLGAVNLLFHLRKKRHRTSLILMHAAVAVSGVVTLVVAIVSSESDVAAQQTPAAPAVAAAPSAAPAPVEAQKSSEPSPPAPATSAAPAGSAAAAEPPTAKELALDASVREVLSRSVTFETKSARIAPESLVTLGALANALEAHPEIALVQVQGHADERGEDASNVALTEARARAVVEALRARGVERSRLHSAGYGARCPADPACASAAPPDACRSPERYAADRRVVFVPLRVGKTALRGEVACARGTELIPAADREYHAP